MRIVEMAAQGPAPFAGALLADFGADVIVIDRPADSGWAPDVPRKFDFYMRNKRSIGIDLKSEAGRAQALDLIGKADVLLEGYRPGVMERLGLGPDVCTAANPALVYGRMTGWGQAGPMAQEAGHDIKYLALTGALHAIGQADAPPPPPLNLVADLGGGAMFLVMGVLTALHEARNSGQGQVVDAAMIDGISQLMSAFQAFRQQGVWSDKRQDNIVDGGAPQFGTYETKDGKYVALGSMEPKFWANLLGALDLSEADIPSRDDRANWPALRAIFADRFKTRTRDEWEAHMAGRDTCFAPVLTIDEAWAHPQMTARDTFVEIDGLRYPGPAPRLSRTPGTHRGPAPEPGANTDEILNDWLGGNR
ncbi:MAG: CaiB/BaiF CoA-transferase family protein [Pseudomonadota bacterium]|nr:CaiB/BaiF CoA-transferase family protein [Pseudomonadota bacterium]